MSEKPKEITGQSARASQDHRTFGNKTNKKNKALLQESWLTAFKESGTVLAACKRLGMTRDTAYSWLKEPAFEAKFASAQEDVTEMCEHAAMARAVNGVDRHVFHKGQPVMTQVMGKDGKPLMTDDGKPVFKPYVQKEYSDHLLIKLLEARNPAKYSQRVHGEFKLDVRIYAEVLTEILAVIRARVPSACPNCKNVLGISELVAKDMEQLSKKFEAVPV